MEDNIDIVRRYLRTSERKKVYQSARDHLPSRLLKKHPGIYSTLMAQLYDLYSFGLDTRVEAQLWLLSDSGRLPSIAEKVKKKKLIEKAKREAKKGGN